MLLTLPQAAAIPFRELEGFGYEVLLVTNSSRDAWVFPKGAVKRGHTAENTALREAWEEAGIEGRLMVPAVGCFSYVKGNGLAMVETFLMKVEVVHDAWEEQFERKRRWVPAPDVLSVHNRAEAQQVLADGLKLLDRLVHGGRLDLRSTRFVPAMPSDAFGT